MNWFYFVCREFFLVNESIFFAGLIGSYTVCGLRARRFQVRFDVSITEDTKIHSRLSLWKFERFVLKFMIFLDSPVMDATILFL